MRKTDSPQITVRRNRNGAVTVKIPVNEIMRAQSLIPIMGDHAIYQQLGMLINVQLARMLMPKKPENPSAPRLVR